MFRIARWLAAVAFTGLALAGCGGGSEADLAASHFEARLAASGITAARVRAASEGSGSSGGALVTVAASNFFDWASVEFPTLFPAPPQAAEIILDGVVFNIRAYRTGEYLAVALGQAYWLGPTTRDQVIPLGPIQAFEAIICNKVRCAITG